MNEQKPMPCEQLVAFLGEMLLIRRFEEKVVERFRAGDLAGFLHAAIGQEAVAVGVCRALANGDVIASTHRAHGHVLANGTPANEVMAELYGKVDGCSHGYGGSMHLYDVERGNMGANAVVGGGLPAAVGAALAFQMRHEPRVAVTFFGDGATNIGTFHESLNLAQLWRVPVVFVCENNRWSESTPQSQHQPIEDLTQRAAAYGMRALRVDGQDVEAVHLTALQALGHARAGRGPVFLLCETERLTGHYIGDPQVYRDKDELRKLQESREPIENLRDRLVISEEEWAGLDAEAQSIVEGRARVRAGGHRSRAAGRTQVRLRGGAMKPRPTSGSCGAPTVAQPKGGSDGTRGDRRGAGYIGSPAIDGIELNELRAAARTALGATLREAIPDAGEVEIERRAVEGAPAAVLVAESRGADLLVVGSRWHGGFAQLLLGSVSQQCAHHAECPVVIVRSKADTN